MSYQCIIVNDPKKDFLSCQHGFMGISVGSHDQSGSKLSAIIDFVLSYFHDKPFTFYLCDSLRWHNIVAMEQITMTDAKMQAMQKADAWFNDNKKHFLRLNSNHAIKRWDESLTNSNYDNAFSSIKFLYESNSEFRQIVLQDVDEHVKRVKKAKNIELNDEALNSLIYHSVNYLLEECAGMAIFFNVQTSSIVEFYPGNLAACLGWFAGRTLPHAIMSLSHRHTAAIKFETKSSAVSIA